MKTESQQLNCRKTSREVLTELCTNVDESRVTVGQNLLILSRDLCKLGLLLMIAPSSNGKTADS